MIDQRIRRAVTADDIRAHRRVIQRMDSALAAYRSRDITAAELRAIGQECEDSRFLIMRQLGVR